MKDPVFINPHITASEPLGKEIIKVLKKYKPDTILDVGASDGQGSTKVLAKNSSKWKAQIHAIEYTESRYITLVDYFKNNDNVIPRLCAASPEIMTDANIRKLHKDYPKWDVWRTFGLDGVIERLYNTQQKLSKIESNGIEAIKKEYDIENFDLVILDGSPFSGRGELEAVYGSDIIVLDDINDIKNKGNYRRLSKSADYTLLTEDLRYRNGYAIFKHK